MKFRQQSLLPNGSKNPLKLSKSDLALPFKVQCGSKPEGFAKRGNYVHCDNKS